MSEFDEYLDPGSREQILRQRIGQFAGEGYQLELNREIAIQTGDTEAAAKADESISVLKTAISVHEQALTEILSSSESA